MFKISIFILQLKNLTENYNEKEKEKELNKNE